MNAASRPQDVKLTPSAVLLLAIDSVPGSMPRARWASQILLEHLAKTAADDSALAPALRWFVGPGGAASARRTQQALLDLALAGALIPGPAHEPAAWVVDAGRGANLGNLRRSLGREDRRAFEVAAQMTKARLVAWSKTAAAAAQPRSSTTTSDVTLRQAVL